MNARTTEIETKIAALLNTGASTVHEASGRRGAMDYRLRSLSGMYVCGPAFTVRCHPVDNLGIHQAVMEAEQSQVLVVDAGGVVAGYWGELLTAMAETRGIKGLVIDGGVRDIAAITQRSFPVFGRGISMLGTSKETPGALGVEVVCGGVSVKPGDWVLGDGDGVVVIESDALDMVIANAQARQAHEEEVLAKMSADVPLVDLPMFGERLQSKGETVDG